MANRDVFEMRRRACRSLSAREKAQLLDSREAFAEIETIIVRVLFIEVFATSGGNRSRSRKRIKLPIRSAKSFLRGVQVTFDKSVPH